MTNCTIEMLQLNGAAVQVLRGGDGPPLLYLHSAGVEGWQPFHDLLARQFQVIAPFHPGYGMSEGGERLDSIEDVVFHYLDLLDLLELERVNVMGLSLGGWIAAELATRHPERVARLVLVDAVGLPVENFESDFEYFLDPLAVPGYIQEVRRRTFCDPTTPVAYGFVPDTLPPDQIPGMLRTRQATTRLAWNPYFHNPKLPGRLHRVKCPTLVVWGDCDGLVPLDVGRLYHQGIPGSRLLIMEKAGHVPPIERPEDFAAAAIEFLSEEQMGHG
jgi:pimeloyl-ACP methyl ester carboxylesterase